jgi:hypothetical protein
LGKLFQESAIEKQRKLEMKLELTSLLIAEFFAFSKLDAPEPVEGFSMEGITDSSDMMACFR